MRINLISGIDEGWTIEKVKNPNQVYAWFLYAALVEAGADARLVKCSSLKRELPPKTDHTIVISSASLTYMRHEIGYAKRLRESTTGKLTSYFNTDELRGEIDHWFDICFTQITPRPGRPDKYVPVGWGVDDAYSYPEQGERAAFMDSKTVGRRWPPEMPRIYEQYDRVLPTLDLKVYNPVLIYNSSTRLPYPEYQAILRKCHFFLCTQLGEGGITRLEAAACGALLVVPRKLYRKRTMSLFNHRIWRTEEDLKDILSEDVDIEANRKRALEHRWADVAKRIIRVLDEPR